MRTARAAQRTITTQRYTETRVQQNDRFAELLPSVDATGKDWLIPVQNTRSRKQSSINARSMSKANSEFYRCMPLIPAELAHSQLLWFCGPVLNPFSANVVSFSTNAVASATLFSTNVVRKWLCYQPGAFMFSTRNTYKTATSF